MPKKTFAIVEFPEDQMTGILPVTWINVNEKVSFSFVVKTLMNWFQKVSRRAKIYLILMGYVRTCVIL